MKETIKNLKIVFYYGKEFKCNLLIQIICSIFRIIVGIILPIFAAKQIVNFTDNLWQKVIYISFTICVIEFLQALNTVIFRRNTQIFRRGTVKNIQMKLENEILKIEQRDIDNNSSEMFIQRIVNDTDNMSLIFTSGMSNLTAVLSSIGAFIAIFFINFQMFIYYFITSIILVSLHLIKIKKYSKKDKEYRLSVEKVAGLIGELVRGIKDIKVLNSKKSFMNILEKNIDEQIHKNFEMRNIEIDYNFFIDSLKGIFELLLIVLLILLICSNKIDIAIAIAIFSYRTSIYSSFMDRISSLFNEINNFNISSQRVMNILGNVEFEKEKFGSYHLDKVEGNIKFENVVFTYENEDIVLNGISFEVKAGETIAFVGKSGVGKTTIFNLLSKLYKVQSGNIFIDGIDINKLDEESIRKNINVINQNPYIFNLSIRENFKLIKKDITDKELKTVCKIACIEDFIETLPEKYDTVLGENGVLLSGGQKQRIAIARALIDRTPILLFDEATSALDNETQGNIQIAIEHLQGNSTIFIIAHRLSTIINCDKIFVLDKGKIVGVGTHEELLKENNVYRKLCENELVVTK